MTLKKIFLTFAFSFIFFSRLTYAGVFDLPSFLEVGQWSLGSEMEFVATQEVGLAANIKPKYGVSNFFNVQGIIGTGFGDRRFRLGAVLDLEFFPDVDRQPGIAAPLTIQYTNVRGGGVLTLGFSPLIYKTFLHRNGIIFTPFFSIPLGWNLRDGNFVDYTQIVLGSLIAPHESSPWKFSLEAGFNVNQTYTYISGGCTYHFDGIPTRASRQAPDRDFVKPMEEPVNNSNLKKYPANKKR